VSTLALIAGAGLLGVAGAAHCTAMCAAPGAALCQHARATAVTAWSFHLARVLGYSAAGALAGAGMALLTGWGAVGRGLQPLWVLLHLVALWCGLWLLWQGRQPAWLERWGRRAAPTRVSSVALPRSRHAAAQPRFTVAAVAAGLAWAAWPCGLLQSALLMAALANDGESGAAVMAVFALCTSPGLVAAPWLWRRLRRGVNDRAGPSIAWALRGGGAMLAGASLWALGHDTMVRALCAV